MTRAVPEWIGATDDTPVPPRVRARVFERFGGRCYKSSRKIGPGDKWECDHVQAIINGGQNRESNLAPLIIDKHREKSREDVRIKSKTAKMKAKHLGIKLRSGRSLTHPFLKRRFDGTVERREEKR